MIDSFPDSTSDALPADLKSVLHTSIENSTPPIGEPKATATPAALAAVKISRILPSWCEHWAERRIPEGRTHSDYGKID